VNGYDIVIKFVNPLSSIKAEEELSGHNSSNATTQIVLKARAIF